MLPVSLNTSSLKCGRWCNGKALNFTIPLNESHLGAILWTVVDESPQKKLLPQLSAQSVVDGETRRLSAAWHKPDVLQQNEDLGQFLKPTQLDEIDLFDRAELACDRPM